MGRQYPEIVAALRHQAELAASCTADVLRGLMSFSERDAILESCIAELLDERPRHGGAA